MARSALFRKFTHLLQAARSEEVNTRSVSASTHQKHRWSRRRFLKYSALTGGAAIATTSLSKLPQLQPVMDYNNPRVAIIGAGIAGLNAAYQLKKLGIVATVYEARAFVGGRIQSRAVVNDRLINDLGGSFINIDYEDTLALVEEFGLELFDRSEASSQSEFPESAYYFNGRTFSDADLVKLLRPLADQLAIDAALLNEDFDTYAPQFDQLSVTDYLNRHRDKILAPVIRNLIENIIRTEYGAEPRESSALQLLFTALLVDEGTVSPINSDETYYIKGGSGRLIESLANALPGQIRVNSPLTELRSQNRGFRLTFSGNIVTEADYVILALPFTALRRVNIQVNLPSTLRRFINEVNLGRNEKLFAGFDRRVWLQDQGFTLDAWTDLGFSSVWEEIQHQPEQTEASLTFFLGGDETQVAKRNVNGLALRFLNRLNQVLPGVQNAATRQFYRTNWADDPYIGGGYTTFRPGQYLEFSEFLYIESDDPEERQDVYVGNLVFAGEHLSDEFYGYMNGGAQTGRLAAEVVGRWLRRASLPQQVA
ncbi:MAG: NAD(P)-binding protein [Leptolyngbyaceae cyanobacterium SL_5_9]|nr:NAD(P)-binding protein [Leptolyngbyaceae cyanobacterium SL_5_9]NJO76323.1 NAD(P)-binding protein [Leptolyngbyaceae cyanobacterium RM1_406_9]